MNQATGIGRSTAARKSLPRSRYRTSLPAELLQSTILRRSVDFPRFVSQIQKELSSHA